MLFYEVSYNCIKLRLVNPTPSTRENDYLPVSE